MTEGISIGSTYAGTNTASQTISKSIEGKDDFLKLLTYQLRSQNPLKPYDNQEFAAQLAQFSQLEQLVDIRSMLEEQIYSNGILTQTIANSALPGMIGKDAKALTDTFNFNGINKHTLNYDMPSNAESAKIIIRDAGGMIIREIGLSEGALIKGSHDFEWDGLNNKGEQAGGGIYTFSVEGTDLSGNSFNAYTYLKGKIEAVRFKAEGTMLVINGTELALNSISDISAN